MRRSFLTVLLNCSGDVWVPRVRDGTPGDPPSDTTESGKCSAVSALLNSPLFFPTWLYPPSHPTPMTRFLSWKLPADPSPSLLGWILAEGFGEPARCRQWGSSPVPRGFIQVPQLCDTEPMLSRGWQEGRSLLKWTHKSAGALALWNSHHTPRSLFQEVTGP